MPDLTPAFATLRDILGAYTDKLVVARDDGQELHLDTHHIQKNKKPLFFGAVQMKKSYVSFHLMPVYLQPDLLRSASPALRAQMQGKSCFNFTSPEPELFKDLSALVKAGYTSYKDQGFVE